MKLKGLFELRKNDQAVSPVIGVILMVAITVILAAVIGTFVLGLGQEMNKNAPTAQISFSQSGNGPYEITVSHDGGDAITPDRISFVFEENSGDTDSISDSGSNWATGDKITAGDTLQFSPGSYDKDDVIKVVWESEDGGTSQVLAEYTVN